MRKIIKVPLKKLKVHEDNPRNNTLAIDKVKASIDRLGFMFPIVIDANYVIVCGHTRRAAAEKKGLKHVPCIMVDDLDPEQIDLFRVIDNKASEYASWDYDKLAAELHLIDLSVEKNDLVVSAFDFDLGPAELESVPTKVAIPTFNFMPEGYKKGKAEQPVAQPKPEDEEAVAQSVGVSGAGASAEISHDVAQASSGEAVIYGDRGKSKPAILHVFRCASRRFTISEIEEDRLNAAYLRYMEEGYPHTTFIKFLLGGAVNDEVQTESAD
jgi:hypothetical protein